jgi:hypothetical protein
VAGTGEAESLKVIVLPAHTTLLLALPSEKWPPCQQLVEMDGELSTQLPSPSQCVHGEQTFEQVPLLSLHVRHCFGSHVFDHVQSGGPRHT